MHGKKLKNTTNNEVKEEPIAAVTRTRKFGKQKNYNAKDQRKCGEDCAEGHNNECKANGETCTECNKTFGRMLFQKKGKMKKRNTTSPETSEKLAKPETLMKKKTQVLKIQQSTM